MAADALNKCFLNRTYEVLVMANRSQLNRQAELFCLAYYPFNPLNLIALFGDEQLGVTDDVDEQDMPDLEFHIWGTLGRHTTSFYLETCLLTRRISGKLRIPILDTCFPSTLNFSSVTSA